MEEEKLIDGLNKEQWKERYIAFMKSHSDAEDWMCQESAEVSWEYSTDESPEESAEEEMCCWD